MGHDRLTLDGGREGGGGGGGGGLGAGKESGVGREPLLLLLGTHADRAGIVGTNARRNGSLQMRRAIPREIGKSAAKLLSSAFIEICSHEEHDAAVALDMLSSELYWRAVQRESESGGLQIRYPKRPLGNDVHPTALWWHENPKMPT
jgi:hypothetical protein